MTTTSLTNGDIVTAGRTAGIELWHYHITLYREIERLHSIGETSYPAKGIAGNIHMMGADVRRYAQDLITSGLIRETDPAWDYEDTWYGLV